MHVSIRVKGHLDPSWQEWLEGLEIVHEPDGTSRLSGTLKDQPALSGVLAKMSRLSLALLSLESSESAQTQIDEALPEEVTAREGWRSNSSKRRQWNSEHADET